eukprot:354169-Chlamydomonas_euryale.AAC.17
MHVASGFSRGPFRYCVVLAIDLIAYLKYRNHAVTQCRNVKSISAEIQQLLDVLQMPRLHPTFALETHPLHHVLGQQEPTVKSLHTYLKFTHISPVAQCHQAFRKTSTGKKVVHKKPADMPTLILVCGRHVPAARL